TISPPKRWSAASEGGKYLSKTFAEAVAPGASVSATFKLTSGSGAFNGDLTATASWRNASGKTQKETATEKLRNVSPIKINEVRIGSGSTNQTDSFIELFNAGSAGADISNWTLTEHPTQEAVFSMVKIPAGTQIAAHGFYL